MREKLSAKHRRLETSIRMAFLADWMKVERCDCCICTPGKISEQSHCSDKCHSTSFHTPGSDKADQTKCTTSSSSAVDEDDKPFDSEPVKMASSEQPRIDYAFFSSNIPFFASPSGFCYSS
uniref:Uncharacterized protein n=1 Tax=Pristionchus pacificus TaxID=54126 RepID=A0A2A6D2P9_PRIPA|eukprot:PDM84587.1 hypothetical protein PRIPAC_33610 [Pristionchus pacificus]